MIEHSSRVSALGLALVALVAVGCGTEAPGPAGTESATTTGAGGHGGGASVAGGAGGSGGGSSVAGGAGGSGGEASAPCPPNMALAGAFCIDRWEAPNQPGQDPLVMQSATLAEQWCAVRGKRLCTEDEWEEACAGSAKLTYPYGDTHVADRCNDDKTWRVVDEATLDTWPSAAAKAVVQNLWQGSPSGELPGCVSSYGVFDLTGNVEEWVVRTRPHVNSYPHVLKGCYWAGCFGGTKPTCQSTNPAHADGFMFYETGFRCCSDVQPGG